MAEALGFAASIISVASLAIQIGDSLRVAIEFWDSIQDGPEELRRISTQLRLLADYMIVIEHEDSAGQIEGFQEQLVRNALSMMKKDTDILANVVSDLAMRIGSTQAVLRRKWARVQIALKEGKLSRLRDHVESAINVLTLLQTVRSQTALIQMNDKISVLAATLERTIAESAPSYHLPNDLKRTPNQSITSSRQSSVHEEKSLAKNSLNYSIRTTFQSTDKVFGFVRVSYVSRQYISTGTFDGEDGNYDPPEERLTLNILLRFLSCRKSFKFRINGTFDDWCLNSIRRLPNDSAIFKFCEEGNARDVEKLIAFRKASVYDVNETGQSVLHIACKHGHPRLCQLLIDQGADVLQTDDFGKIPLQYSSPRAAPLKFSKSDLSKFSETWDVLVRQGQCNPFAFSYNYSSAQLQLKSWKYVLVENPFLASAGDRLGLIYQAMTQFESFDDTQYMDIHGILFSLYDRIVNSQGLPEKNPSPLLHRLLRGWMARDSLGDKRTVMADIKLTTDLHRPNSVGKTALDVVLAFNCGDEQKKIDLLNKWIALLSEAGINLHEYGQKELDLHPNGLTVPKCCREIKAEIVFDQSNQIQINVTENIVKPQHQSLDPEYICEAWRGRESCLSKVDRAFIKDGRPLPSIPGSWEKPLKPNSDLKLREGSLGFRYCDDS